MAMQSVWAPILHGTHTEVQKSWRYTNWPGRYSGGTRWWWEQYSAAVVVSGNLGLCWCGNKNCDPHLQLTMRRDPRHGMLAK